MSMFLKTSMLLANCFIGKIENLDKVHNASYSAVRMNNIKTVATYMSLVSTQAE